MKKEHEKYEHESKAYEMKEHKKHHKHMPHIGNKSVEHMLEANNKLIEKAMGKTKRKLM